MPHISASEALSHITVLDLTRVRSGPTAVRQLADWGANVIKIEPPESIEPDGSLGASRDTADFQNLHRNKRSLTLNLKDKKAIEDASANLRNALKGTDLEEIKKKTQDLVQASMKLGEAIYKSQQGAKPDDAPKDDSKGENKKDDNVVDADFEEVKDENKEKSA